MAQKSSDSRTLIIVAFITGIFGIITACITGFFALKASQSKQDTLATNTALVQQVDSGNSTQASLAQTVDAPSTPVYTQTSLPTYTPFPTMPPTSTVIPSTSTPTVQLPFSDNFDNGANSNWEPISGTWRVVDGKYTATGPTAHWYYSLVGDQIWKDYAIDVDYSTETDCYNYVSVVVRATESNGLGLQFSTQPCNSRTAWSFWQDGNWTNIATKDASTTNGHIHIEVRGSTFTANISGVTQLTVTDESMSTGRVGIGSRCRSESNCPTFDNFVVTQINP